MGEQREWLPAPRRYLLYRTEITTRCRELPLSIDAQCVLDGTANQAVQRQAVRPPHLLEY